jgi:hypothetical protein
VSRSIHGHKHVGRRKCGTCRYLGIKEAQRQRSAEHGRLDTVGGIDEFEDDREERE